MGSDAAVINIISYLYTPLQFFKSLSYILISLGSQNDLVRKVNILLPFLDEEIEE